MKRIVLVMVAVFALLVSMMVAFASTPSDTPNDPHVNADANACYTGGSMAGKCGLDDELWIAGWYEIRLEYGTISRGQVPDQYKWLLSSPQTTDEPGPTPTPTATPNPCGIRLTSTTNRQPACFQSPDWWTI